MAKQTPRKKTSERRIEGDGGTEAKFPLLNGYIAGYEKWARETVAGITGPFKRESPEWFAQGIIRYVDELRFYLDESMKNRATKEAYEGEAVDRVT